MRIKTAMLFRRELQADIARLLGIHKSGVSHRFAGNVLWTLDEVDRLAQHFGCEPVDLLTDGQGFLDRIQLPEGRGRVRAEHFEAVEDPSYMAKREERLARRRAKARTGGVNGRCHTVRRARCSGVSWGRVAA